MSNTRHLLTLCVLASIWGSSFMFIKLAVPHFGPVPLTALRSLFGALALSPFLFGAGRPALIGNHWPHLLVIGLISTALPFICLSLTTKYSSAGFASIINSLTPIFSALIGWAWIGEKPSARTCIGILLGFVGVGILVLDERSITTSVAALPVLIGLGATFCYALTGFYSRRYLSTLPSTLLAAGCQLSSALCLLPFAALLWPRAQAPLEIWLVAAVLGILCTGVAFILYFNLLERVGVARTVIVTYLIPVFAMLWGKLFLDELVTPTMLTGAALVLTGIALATIPAQRKNSSASPATKERQA